MSYMFLVTPAWVSVTRRVVHLQEDIAMTTLSSKHEISPEDKAFYAEMLASVAAAAVIVLLI